MGSESRAELRHTPKSGPGGVTRWIRRIGPRERPRDAAVPMLWLQRPELATGGRVDVIVDAHEREALARLAGGLSVDGPVQRHFMAQLVREFRDVQDPDAVRVDIGGYSVGYLAREEAPWFHPVVGELARHGRPATCRAVITGGVDSDDGDRSPLSVVLDVSVPLRMTPADAPLFPGGSRVEVSNVDDYQAALAVLLGDADGAVSVLATLTTAEYSKIDVYVGAEMVGDLAPLLSARYLPAVMEVWAAREVPTCCAVIVRAENRIEVELDLWLPED
jgi:hypothetical protein